MIDTHCHLTHTKFDEDRGQVVARAREAGLLACVSIGTGVSDADSVAALVARHAPFVEGTAGLDPFSAHRAGDGFDDALAALEEMFAAVPFRAVGEIGLDYHYDLDPRPLQRSRFERQLDLAERLALPVVIHVRDAHDDMAAVLAEHPRARGVIHSFTAGPREADRYLELGWMLAFNGVLTFRNAGDVREAARRVPLDRLLVETDSPYLAPEPRRGKRCEPADVVHTLERLAAVRAEPLAEVRRATTRNAVDLFGLSAAAIIDR